MPSSTEDSSATPEHSREANVKDRKREHSPASKRSHRERSRSPRRRRSRSRSRSPRRRDRHDRHRNRDDHKDRRDRHSDRDRRRGDRYVSDHSRKEEMKNDPIIDDRDNNHKKPKETNEKKDILTSRTGGAYIPPARLRMMQEQITDKSSENYQRLSWEALKKSINGLVNKVNVGNMSDIIRELFKENIVRGRGLLARSVITAQAASPTFTHVYAALVAVINTKFPQIGELLLKRLLIQFKRTMKRGDKATCLTTAKFLAHLVNQQVIHELVILEILTVFLENPTEDSVEVAVGVIKECGKKLGELSPTGIRGIFDRFRSIIQDSDIGKRVQYMIEVLFAIRKDDFKDYPTVIEELVLVEESDQITHFLSLDDAADGENILNIFKFDPDYLQNEERYQVLRKGILGDDDDGSSASGSDEESDDDDDDDEEEEKDDKMILDQTETNLVALRRNIYLTIQSSLDFEECAHKLLKMEIKPGQEKELCSMIIDCCAQERSYLRMYGLLAQRFCQLNKTYVELYDEIFQDQYENCHRLETNKLRNVVKFFAHLFFTDAIPWTALSCIHLNEDETTSSSRIFAKILLQELSEYMGIMKLNKRFRDETLAEFFEGLFPRNNPSYTRFAINFFTSIGLGALTDELRAHLKNAPKLIMAQKRAVESSDDSSSSDSNSDSDSDSDSSSESTSSSSGSSEDSANAARKKGGYYEQKNERSRSVSPRRKRRDDFNYRDRRRLSPDRRRDKS